MILLKPIFDIHIRELNERKVSVFATTEEAKTFCRPYFKSNDFCFDCNYEGLDRFVDEALAAGLKTFIDSGVRCRDKCPKNRGRYYDSLLCDSRREPDAAV